MKIPQKPPKISRILSSEHTKIFALLEDESILQLINKYNKNYVHWDELRYKKLPKELKPEFIWALLKIFRSQQYKKLKFDACEMRKYSRVFSLMTK